MKTGLTTIKRLILSPRMLTSLQNGRIEQATYSIQPTSQKLIKDAIMHTILASYILDNKNTTQQVGITL